MVYRLSWLDPKSGECVGMIDFFDEQAADYAALLIESFAVGAAEPAIEEVM